MILCFFFFAQQKKVGLVFGSFFLGGDQPGMNDEQIGSTSMDEAIARWLIAIFCIRSAQKPTKDRQELTPFFGCFGLGYSKLETHLNPQTLGDFRRIQLVESCHESGTGTLASLLGKLPSLLGFSGAKTNESLICKYRSLYTTSYIQHNTLKYSTSYILANLVRKIIQHIRLDQVT